VYGERHPLKGQYAPVVGLFLKQFKDNKSLTVVGDGTQKRDFTNIKDAVEANILAALSENQSLFGETYNIGTGQNISILDIAKTISDDVEYIDARPGEVKETLADNNKAKNDFGWEPKHNLLEWINNAKSSI
jgi:nucleoside-diphosphate-sugar epimerase